MCRKHWGRVPKPLQRAVWQHYRPGQEVDKKPTAEYLQAAKAAIEFVCGGKQQPGNVDLSGIDTTPGSGGLLAPSVIWAGDIEGYMEEMRRRWADLGWAQQVLVAGRLWRRRCCVVSGPLVPEAEMILRKVSNPVVHLRR